MTIILLRSTIIFEDNTYSRSISSELQIGVAYSNNAIYTRLRILNTLINYLIIITFFIISLFYNFIVGVEFLNVITHLFHSLKAHIAHFTVILLLITKNIYYYYPRVINLY